MPYDVVPRYPRSNLADVSHLHHNPAGDPAATGNLAILNHMSLVSCRKVHTRAEGTLSTPPAERRVEMKVHLLLQFRMVLKEKCCV